MKKNAIVVACVTMFFVVLGCSGAFALTVDDVVKLAKGGLSDEVIMSQIAAEKAVFKLSSDEIIELKKAGVSDRVIGFMVQTRLAGGADTGVAVAETVPAAATGKTTLVLSNQDSQSYSAVVDAAGRSIFIFYGNPKDKICLYKGIDAEFEIPAGEYAVKWVGASEAFAFVANEGDRCRVVLSRVDLTDIEALNVSIFVRDALVAGGTLMKFSEAVVEETPQAPIIVQVPQPQPRPVVVYQPAYPTYSDYIVRHPSYCTCTLCHPFGCCCSRCHPVYYPRSHWSFSWTFGHSSRHHSHDRGHDCHSGGSRGGHRR